MYVGRPGFYYAWEEGRKEKGGAGREGLEQWPMILYGGGMEQGEQGNHLLFYLFFEGKEKMK